MSEKSYNDYEPEVFAQKMKETTNNAGQVTNIPGPCPSCGHCPTCGRGGYYTAPRYPWGTPYWGTSSTPRWDGGSIVYC